jgi:hypothetical protein
LITGLNQLVGVAEDLGGRPVGYATAMWLNLYWLIFAAVASLLGGVVNAWLFLVRMTS